MASGRAAPDLQGGGTLESIWSACSPLADLGRWQPRVPASGRVVVVAPHPDDEILGPGGTLARLSRVGAEVVLVAVTDGERSHPGMERHLRAVRPLESLAAAGRLGIEYGAVHRLRHPDGKVDERGLVDQLADVVQSGDLMLAPWRNDGHPDHDAVGRAAEQAAARSGAHLLSYLVWAWHWASPDDLPWEQALRVDITDVAAAKRHAAACFTSQIAVEPVILAAHVRRRLLRSYEVLLQS